MRLKSKVNPSTSSGQKSKIERGFTLIEFLTVTVVLSVIGLVIIGILNSALRGSNKTNTVNLIRTNGNQAQNLMVKTIGYAKGFDGVDDGVNGFKTDCVQIIQPAPTPTPIPIIYKKVKVTGYDDVQTTFSCETDKITANNVPIIDTNTVSLVSGKCWFTCIQDRATSNPIIGISFSLKQKAGNALVEKTATMNFETSVTFRNLIK